jgi:signal transduction histidine kinase
MVAVSDADGAVIRFFASDTREAVINFFEGASWNERDIGTNGIGTALSAGEPVLVVGPQHFVHDYRHWTCIGVPLCSADGRVLGALDLSVRNDRLNAHTWGWTLSLAKSIEVQLGRDYGPHIFDVEEIESMHDPARLRAMVRRLLEERDQLDVWDRRKDGAVATLSHELSNPLSAMALSIDLLERSREVPGRVGEVSERLRHQVRRLAKVVGDIGDVAQVKTGTLVIHREAVDLNAVLSSAAEGMQPQMDELHHALVVRLPGHPLPALGDPERLEQVFTNVLGNAAKYTPPGGRIAVDVEALPDEARIRVRDNGIGIPPEDLERVFAEFARVVRPDGDPGGRGIGLAVVRNIVRLHGGTVTARSEGQGKGTEIEVRLPLATGSPG